MEHFFKALTYSRDGFLTLLREKAFRQELILLALAFGFVGTYSGLAALADVLPWGLLVLVVEALNTGIEKVVDLCSPDWHKLAKQSKDTASFACGTAIAIFFFVCARAVLRG